MQGKIPTNKGMHSVFFTGFLSGALIVYLKSDITETCFYTIFIIQGLLPLFETQTISGLNNNLTALMCTANTDPTATGSTSKEPSALSFNTGSSASSSKEPSASTSNTGSNYSAQVNEASERKFSELKDLNHHQKGLSGMYSRYLNKNLESNDIEYIKQLKSLYPHLKGASNHKCISFAMELCDKKIANNTPELQAELSKIYENSFTASKQDNQKK